MGKTKGLQRRHYMKIADDADLTLRALGSIVRGPEHDAYYDVSEHLDAAIKLMNPDQRYALVEKYRHILEIWQIGPKDIIGL